jgi:hypothetical protein
MSLEQIENKYTSLNSAKTQASRGMVVKRPISTAIPDFTSTSLIRSILLSKLTFNLSKGHYSFVYELLKTKSEHKQNIGVEANANEIASNSQMWLQLETNKLNKKFLNGKTPLILCSYIKENEWCLTLTRLLLENGAHISLKDTITGCGPLHYACAMLKCDQIELYLKSFNFNLQKAKDFNGNTPLVYFMVSFSFYYNRILPPTSTRSQKRLNFSNFNELSDEFHTNSANSDRIYEYVESFQARLVNTLKAYLKYLKRHNMIANTTNRLGYSLQDFYTLLTSYSRGVESHEFFILIREAITNETHETREHSYSNSTSSSVSNATPRPTHPFKASQTTIQHITSKSTLYTASQYVFNEYPNILKLNKPTAAPITNNSQRKDKEVPAKSKAVLANILPKAVENIVKNDAHLSTSRSHIETILRKNLLIDLNEMKLNKLIAHSKKVDKNLLNLFVNRRVMDKNSLSFFDSSDSFSQAYNSNRNANLKNLSYKSLHDADHLQARAKSGSTSNMASKSNEINECKEASNKANLNNSWRDILSHFYDDLKDNTTNSYRKGIKIVYEVEKLPTKPNSQTNSKVNLPSISRLDMNSSSHTITMGRRSTITKTNSVLSNRIKSSIAVNVN